MNDWAVVGIPPFELDRVRFLVTVLHFAGTFGDKDRHNYERVFGIGCVRLDSEHIVRRKELVYPLGFIRSQRLSLDFVGLFSRLVVKARCAVDNGQRAIYIRLGGRYYR